MAKVIPYLDINSRGEHTVYLKNSASSVPVGDNVALDAFYQHIKDYIVENQTPLGRTIEQRERDERLRLEIRDEF